MKTSSVLGLAAVALITLALGCSNVKQLRTDSAKRVPTETVDIFMDGKLPTEPGKEIAVLSCQSYPHRQLGVLSDLVAQAKRLGGNAIIVTSEQTGFSADLFGTAQRVLYRAKVIVYESRTQTEISAQTSPSVPAPTQQTLRFPAVASFNDYNEVLTGEVIHNPSVGESVIHMTSAVSGARYSGKSWVTYVPPTAGVVGQQGRVILTGTDGRVVAGTWTALSLTSGFGTGSDQRGDTFAFVFGMTESEANAIIKRELSRAASRPEIPPVYRPKETRKERGFCVGTGFFVTQDGILVTNFHVIEDATEVRIVLLNGTEVGCRVLQTDEANDIAILKAETASRPVAVMDAGRVLRGEEVFTLGYPLSSIVGQGQKATFGRVNALAGIGEDVRYLQIDAPIQPGNSGGPLLNKQGQVIGIVTSTLNALAVLRESGALPQNVNYAVKADYLIPLLRRQIGGRVQPVTRRATEDFASLIQDVEASVVMVIAR